MTPPCGWRLTITAAVTIAGPLAGQHVPDPAVTGRPEGAGTCEWCHGAHRSPGGALLITDEGVSAGGGPASGSSRSCLRCHLTPSVRGRQPEFAAAGSPPVSMGKYLGADYSNGHLLGSTDRRALESRAPLRWDPRVVPGRPGEWTVDLQCPSCHDPHARSGPLPDETALRRICGGCHDPARYELRGHVSLSCIECHDVHGNRRARLKADSPEALCRSCHNAAGLKLRPDAGRAALPTLPVGHVVDRSANAQSCTGCHAAHH